MTVAEGKKLEMSTRQIAMKGSLVFKHGRMMKMDIFHQSYRFEEYIAKYGEVSLSEEENEEKHIILIYSSI